MFFFYFFLLTESTIRNWVEIYMREQSLGNVYFFELSRSLSILVYVAWPREREMDAGNENKRNGSQLKRTLLIKRGTSFLNATTALVYTLYRRQSNEREAICSYLLTLLEDTARQWPSLKMANCGYNKMLSLSLSFFCSFFLSRSFFSLSLSLSTSISLSLYMRWVDGKSLED